MSLCDTGLRGYRVTQSLYMVRLGCYTVYNVVTVVQLVYGTSSEVVKGSSYNVYLLYSTVPIFTVQSGLIC